MLLEREHQLRALEDLLADAHAGHGHLALLGGEAGVGKSALVTALARQVSDTAGGAFRVRRGACDDLTTAAPLGPVIEALPEVEPLLEGTVSRPTLLRRVRYWVDEPGGKIFCLVDAPDAEAANTVHGEAHGLVADEIHPVSEGE